MSRQPIVDETAVIQAIQLDAENASRWASEQAEDTDLELVYDRQLRGMRKHTFQEMRGLNEDARILWNHSERLKITDGVLFYKWNSHDPKRLILPRRTVPQIIRQLHESLGQRRKEDGTSSKAQNARRYRRSMQYLPAVRDVQVPNSSSKGAIATLRGWFP